MFYIMAYCNINDAYDQPYYDAQGINRINNFNVQQKIPFDHLGVPKSYNIVPSNINNTQSYSHNSLLKLNDNENISTFNLKKENQMEFINNKKYIDHDFYIKAFINNPLDQYFYNHICECNVCKHNLKSYLNQDNRIEHFTTENIFGYNVSAKELCAILIICFIAIFIIDVVAKTLRN